MQKVLVWLWLVAAGLVAGLILTAAIYAAYFTLPILGLG
jgi:hypothetical protein